MFIEIHHFLHNWHIVYIYSWTPQLLTLSYVDTYKYAENLACMQNLLY